MLDSVVCFRVSPDEHQMLKFVSELSGRSLSEFVRMCAMGIAQEIMDRPDTGRKDQ